MILYLISCLDWNVSSFRLTLDRALTASACTDVWDPIQCKSGVTLNYRPKDSALAMTRFQELIGVKKGNPKNGAPVPEGRS